MKRLLVISDNHGKTERMESILEKENFDLAIHLGDSELPEDYIEEKFDYYVEGNHDTYKYQVVVFKVENINIAIAHGHPASIGFGFHKNAIVEFGKRNNADLVLHGHLHIASDNVIDGIRVICPGSVDYSRSGKNSYAIITIDGDEITSEFFEA